MEQFFLNNKNIVITGASSGIGQACAILCSQAGATVLLVGRNVERLAETRSQMKQPEQHSTLVLDLSDTNMKDAEAAVKLFVAQTGKIDGVINAAGIPSTIPFRSMGPKHLEDAFRVNVVGTMLFTKILLRAGIFCAEGGSVVFIASVMGMVGESAKSVYGMTKGALIAGSKTMALEYAPRKIRINCISPGVVLTPMSMQSEYSKNEESFNAVREKHPLGYGTPQDIANASIYLLSEASRWITGTNLVVDGGYTCY
jgi:NAD(P)-dependent dehydrogenase (short-subunit alcohol dehydrogenase family)